jgi:long-chain acyl-CoA synthetase
MSNEKIIPIKRTDQKINLEKLYKTMPKVFQERVSEYKDRQVLLYKKEGKYTPISWIELDTMVKNLAFYFLQMGIKKEDKIALFSENRYEWWLSDLAIISLGAITVPVYSTNSADEAHYILDDSSAIVCIVSTKTQLDRVLQNIDRLPNIKKIITMEKMETAVNDDRIITLTEAMEIGSKNANLDEFNSRLSNVKSEDIMTIIYTSGTVGVPKGVMITHDNIFSQVHSIFFQTDIFYYLDDRDVWLSFLPLSHVLERMASYYGPMNLGATVAFAENLTTLLQNFLEVKPTIIISVPRIYEKVYAALNAKFKASSVVKRLIFKMGIGVARKALPYIAEDRKPTGLLGFQYKIMNKLLYTKIKKALGFENITFAVSGGAPLGVTEAEFFVGMGITILEGYGLTETAPVTNLSMPGKIGLGTVGPAIPETDVKISDEGEVLIKGRQVMKGYYKNPEATKETFTEDGYFKTGDLGIIDSSGRLTITGRIKDIIITAGGKNISPQNIEIELKNSPYIEHVALIGDKRKYLSALVVPSFEAVKKWAAENEVTFESNTDLISNPKVIKLIENEVEGKNQRFSRVEQIKKITLLDADWSQESGELTPKQSVKRRVIESKYGELIEKMYMGDVQSIQQNADE